MASFKLLAFMAMACLASIAEGSLSNDDVPEVISQQRALLQATAKPAYYGPPPPQPPKPKNQRIFATVVLLIRPGKGKTADFKLGASTLIRNLKAVQATYNKKYKAANNIAVVYQAGPKTIKGRQAWVYYRIAADIGPPGATYKAALRNALKRAVKKTTKFVVRVRGNFA